MPFRSHETSKSRIRITKKCFGFRHLICNSIPTEISYLYLVPKISVWILLLRYPGIPINLSIPLLHFTSHCYWEEWESHSNIFSPTSKNFFASPEAQSIRPSTGLQLHHQVLHWNTTFGGCLLKILPPKQKGGDIWQSLKDTTLKLFTIVAKLEIRYDHITIIWVVPVPSNSGKWRLLGIPLLKVQKS